MSLFSIPRKVSLRLEKIQKDFPLGAHQITSPVLLTGQSYAQRRKVVVLASKFGYSQQDPDW